MIEAVRNAFGAKGIEKLIRERTKAQAKAYRERMPDDLPGRVRMLARIRTEEGYLAESRKEADGSFTLIENHCPICAAAAVCPSLCRDELSLFKASIGKGIPVERVEYILAGSRRCAYRIGRASDT